MTEDEIERLVHETQRVVWRELYARRWFGKHIDEAEMDQLTEDVNFALRRAVKLAAS